MSKPLDTRSSKKVSHLFRVLGQPSHLEILLAIGTGEACVCHLEAATGWRQAYVSQHLMALRDEGLVVSRRDGRNIFYRLKNAAVLNLIRTGAGVTGHADFEAALDRLAEPLAHCPCPHCSLQRAQARGLSVADLATGES